MVGFTDEPRQGPVAGRDPWIESHTKRQVHKIEHLKPSMYGPPNSTCSANASFTPPEPLRLTKN